MSIEYESTDTLKAWLDEYNKYPDKIILPNCIYNRFEIERELCRRDFLEGALEDWLNDPS